MWQVNPLLLRGLETRETRPERTHGLTLLVAGWLRLTHYYRWHGVGADMFVFLVAVVIQMLTITFVAASASRVAVETQLWLTWATMATAIPTAVRLFTVYIQVMLMHFVQGCLHVSLVAVVTQLWLMRGPLLVYSYHWHRCTRCFCFADCCGY